MNPEYADAAVIQKAYVSEVVIHDSCAVLKVVLAGCLVTIMSQRRRQRRFIYFSPISRDPSAQNSTESGTSSLQSQVTIPSQIQRV